jgi:hypothetical protein
MIYLKNTSDENKNGSVTIDISMSEHPITNSKEWTEIPNKTDGSSLSKTELDGFKEKDKSKTFNCIIKPGEVAAFGAGSKLNEEHAEYVYQLFGSPEYADEYGRKNKNWLIEVDKDGAEIKDNLFEKYRSSYKGLVDFRKSNKEKE